MSKSRRLDKKKKNGVGVGLWSRVWVWVLGFVRMWRVEIGVHPVNILK